MRRWIQKIDVGAVTIGMILYLWLAFYILWGIGSIFHVGQPFLFWILNLLFLCVLLLLLSVSDHIVYQRVVPIYSPTSGIEVLHGVAFLFIRRLFWVSFMAIPLMVVVFVVVPLGFLTFSWAFSFSMDEWIPLLSRMDVQGGFWFLAILYYWVFGIRFLFVDFFLLEKPDITILQAFSRSYRYCHWKRWKLTLLSNKSYFMLQCAGILILLIFPVQSPVFWVLLGIFIAGYQWYYFQLKKWEWKYWESLKNPATMV